MSHRTRLISIAASALALAGTLLLWPAGAALAAITFISPHSQASGDVSTLVIPKPANAQEGHFLLTQLFFERGSGTTIAPPTGAGGGWTLLLRTNRSTEVGQAIYYKFAGASEPTSYSWGVSPQGKHSGAILAYSGVHTTDPIVLQAVAPTGGSGNTGDSGTLTATSINAVANSKLLAFFGIQKKDITLALATTSPSNQMTQRYSFVPTNEEASILAADQDVGAGGTGNRVATSNSGGKWVAQLVALRSAPEAPLDTDGDGVPDVDDNCPDDPNPDQADADNDGIGDVCEPDTDGDGVIDDIDNCVDDPNSNQADTDEDGIGDACDLDGDNDDVNDDVDNCPFDYNPDQTDTNNDGVGDACDTLDDGDGDGVPDGADQCLDTGSGEVVDATGCSIAQLCPCENAWRNHGAYVSCVSTAAENLFDLGLISETEKGAIVSAAGLSQCGARR